MNHFDAGVSIGLWLSASFDNPQMPIQLGPSVFILSLIFSGFTINETSVSALFRPLQELSFIRYAFRGVLVNEFKDQTYQCDKRADVCFPTGQAFLEHMDFGDSDITSNALPLLYFFLAMNVLAYVVLLRTRMNNIEYFPPNLQVNTM